MKTFAKLIIVFSAFIFQSNIKAQSLTDAIKKISAEVSDVQAEKLSYSQSFQADSKKTYKIIFVQKTIDAKGKQASEEIEFNLADIDKNTVRWKEGKVLSVSLNALKSQKFIKVSKNGVFDGYVNDLVIYAKNIDNARNLETVIKEAIPLAKTMSDADLNISGKNLGELLSLLNKCSPEILAGDTKYLQKFEAAGAYMDRMKQTIETYGSKGLVRTETYEFSVGDLNEVSLNLVISSKFAAVESGTKRNLKWITASKDGKSDGFAKEIKIYAADPDQGKFILNIFQQLIPLGESEIKKRIPKATGAEALKLFCAIPPKLSTEKGDIEQKLQNSCVTVLTVKKNTESLEYAFNFGDLNEKTLSFDISNKGVSLKAKVLFSEEWIQEKKDGVLQGYEDDLTFMYPDVESGRYFEALLPSVIARCHQIVKPNDFIWLQKSLSVYDSKDGALSQKLELQSSQANCKWKFSRVSNNGKTSTEEIYEFGLADMDFKTVNIKVSGKKVMIVLQTKFKQKIISYYKDGKPGYQSDFNIEFPDIESAKAAKETLVSLLENCKSN